MAPLRYAAKFDPFLSLDCAPTPSTLAQSRKGRNQILPSGNLGQVLIGGGDLHGIVGLGFLVDEEGVAHKTGAERVLRFCVSTRGKMARIDMQSN